MAFDPSVSRAAQVRVLGALVAGQVQPDALRPDQWPDVCDLALQHGLGPFLLWQVQQAGCADALGAVLLPLRAARARGGVQSLLVRRTRRRIHAALTQAGIACLWLKGSALAETVYPAPELRPMVDVDLLVSYTQREAALHVLEKIGYRLLPQLFDGTEALKHHYALQGSEGDKLLVELHFRLLGAADRLLPVQALDWFWQQTMVFGDTGGGEAEMATLRPEAHLLYLAAHALLQHGEADLRLLRFFDLDRLLRATPDFDWELTIAGATTLGWTYVTAHALQLAQRHFATPLPAQVLDMLAARRPAHDTVVHVQRRRRPRTLSERVMHDLATMGWRDGLRTVQRILLPPPAYMRWRYAVDGTWRLPAAYWARWRHMAQDAWYTLQGKRPDKGVRHG
jgi:hypothetical protein